jgi:PIN domain nuclease of toxin-antitoxin system
VKILIDTHVLIWALLGLDALSPRARTALEDSRNVILVSAVSAFEIELKRRADALIARLPRNLEQAVIAADYVWLPVTASDAASAARLPLHHRDPWDRIMIAQANNVGAPFMTVDRAIADYDVEIFW